MSELSNENPILESLPVVGALSLLHLKGTEALSIAIDIDGTLCPQPMDSSEYATLELFPGCKETISTLKNLGVRIIIWTARTEEWRAITEYWLNDKGIPFDELVMGKPNAQLYIDDKALKFTTWSDIIARLMLPQTPQSPTQTPPKVSESKIEETKEEIKEEVKNG